MRINVGLSVPSFTTIRIAPGGGGEPAGTITIDTLTYTRGTAGVAPDLASTVSSTGTTTGDYTLYWATRSTGTALSKSAIENGTGDTLENGSVTSSTLTPISASLDLANSLTSGAIDVFIRDSSGIESDVVSVTGVTYDAVAPAFSSAVIEGASPSTMTLTLDKDGYVAAGETLAVADFTFGGTIAANVNGVTRTNATTYTFTLSAPAVNGDTLTVALASGTLVGIDAEAATFTAQSVTNNVAAVSTAFTDDFNRADEALEASADWDEVNSTGGGTADIVSNQLVFQGNTSAVASYVTTDTKAADQYTQIDVVNIIADGKHLNISIVCRATVSGVDLNGYIVIARGDIATITLYEWTGGIFTQIGSQSATQIQNGDTLRIEASGSTITVLLNGSTLISETDTTYSGSGAGGIYMFALDPDAVLTLDNFEHGEL